MFWKKKIYILIYDMFSESTEMVELLRMQNPTSVPMVSRAVSTQTQTLSRGTMLHSSRETR